MDDLREKVIRGLECCSNGICYAGKCPYENGDNESIECIKKLAEDALSLLKAQEPRVMTPEEALEADVCWLEVEDMDRIPPCRIGENQEVYFVKLFVGGPEYFHKSEYGSSLRCWTSRPTDEQREAVKWE